MNPVNRVQVTLEPAAFAVIREMLLMLRLGDNNQWETSVKNTLIAWELSGLSELNEKLYHQLGDVPDITVVASNNDGVVFEVN